MPQRGLTGGQGDLTVNYSIRITSKTPQPRMHASAYDRNKLCTWVAIKEGINYSLNL